MIPPFERLPASAKIGQRRWPAPSLSPTRQAATSAGSNEIVKPIHVKAMPAILTAPEEIDLWLTGSWDEVKHLQRPLPGNMLVEVEPPAKPDEDTL